MPFKIKTITAAGIVIGVMLGDHLYAERINNSSP
jgi:hypothetical protein